MEHTLPKSLSRYELVAFLQDTSFYVVEEGRLSRGWQSPLQRRLASGVSTPKAVFAGRSFRPGSGSTSFAAGGLRGGAAGRQSKQSAASPFHDVQGLEKGRRRRSFGTAEDMDRTRAESDEKIGEQWTATRSREREAEQWEHGRGLGLAGASESHASCPLVYTVDAKTARKHGLVLFQEELDLLGTVTARLCRCLCHFPTENVEQKSRQGTPPRRTASTQSTDGQATHGWPLDSVLGLLQSNESEPEFAALSGSPLERPSSGPDALAVKSQRATEDRRTRRRLGVCHGEAHALMLEEMLKGANVVISGDSGWFYRWFASMQEAYRRTCSHFSTRSTLGIPEGTLLRTVLTGTDMYEDSWFQLEGAAWRPFRHPIDAVRHGFNFMQYKLRQSQVGPLGKSTHTDLQPMMVTFDGCVSTNDASGRQSGGRLLMIPKDHDHE